MGHLTEIANSLQAVAARRPAVARTLCSNAAWTDFAFRASCRAQPGGLPSLVKLRSHALAHHTLPHACAMPISMQLHAPPVSGAATFRHCALSRYAAPDTDVPGSGSA